MPIPSFDHNDVLPAYTGDVTQPANMSPYRITAMDVVQRFATSPARAAVLAGWLQLREDLRALNLGGFQWVDGSFVEDVEKIRGRAPDDIDVVTFFHPPAGPVDPVLAAVLGDHGQTKARYRVDHYLVPLRDAPERLVDNSRFWFGLFSHQKGTSVWKGMLHVDLLDVASDTAARQALAALVFP